MKKFIIIIVTIIIILFISNSVIVHSDSTNPIITCDPIVEPYHVDNKICLEECTIKQTGKKLIKSKQRYVRANHKYRIIIMSVIVCMILCCALIIFTF